MKTIIIFLIFPLSLWSCQHQHTNDLIPILTEYHESIWNTNQSKLHSAIYYMERCGKDSLLNKFKEEIQIINKIEQRYSQRINEINNIQDINSLYKSYGDSLFNSITLRSLIAKDTKLIELGKIDHYTVPELKIITETNLLLYEMKLRGDILGSIAIDCPEF